MDSRQFAALIKKARYNPNGWSEGLCPAHDDREPSLGWKDGDVKIGIKCQAGCTRDQVLAALRLTEEDTWLRPKEVPAVGRRIIEAYDYRDERGALLFQTVRYEPKGFTQRRPDGAGGWAWNLGGVRLVLYRLDAIQGCDRVVVVEGEKDADRLARTGLRATTSPMGAGKWRDDYAAQLAAAGVLEVIVVPDNDDAGVKHAEVVRDSCLRADLAVAVVQLPDVPPKGDASDYLDAHTVNELYNLLFVPNDRRALRASERMDAAAGRFNDALEPLLAGVADGDLRAIADAMKSVDPAVYAPFSLDMILGAAFEVNGITAEPRPYPDDAEMAPRERPTMTVSGDRYEDKRAMWAALVGANEPPVLFLLGDVKVKLRKDGFLAPLDQDKLHAVLVDAVRWVDPKMRPAKLDVQVIRMMLAEDEPPMPRLERVARTPVFSDTGRLVQEPGYDAESGIYLAIDGLAVPTVSDAPMEADVAKARELLLDDLLFDFPFVSQADCAAAVALLLLPFARAMIDGPTPLHIIEAPTPGTGKSLLLKAITTVALGREAGAMTEAEDEEEMRKRITAQLLREPTFVVVENLNKMMRGGAISQALTARTWEDRILGVNKIASCPVRCCWIAVANNPEFSDEVADRIVSCRIDRKVERPRDLNPDKFKHRDLERWARENRGNLVWACLTLMQNWIARDHPKGGVSLGSFQAWAETMSGILEAAGVSALLENRKTMLERADPVADSRKAFVEAWYAEHGTNAVRIAQLASLATAAGCPVDAGKVDSKDKLAQSEVKRMDNILKKLVDQVYVINDGSVAVSYGDPKRDRNGALWRLIPLTGPKKDDEPDWVTEP